MLPCREEEHGESGISPPQGGGTIPLCPLTKRTAGGGVWPCRPRAGPANMAAPGLGPVALPPSLDLTPGGWGSLDLTPGLWIPGSAPGSPQATHSRHPAGAQALGAIIGQGGRRRPGVPQEQGGHGAHVLHVQRLCGLWCKYLSQKRTAI